MDAIQALQQKQTAVENEYNILVHDVEVLEAEVCTMKELFVLYFKALHRSRENKMHF